MRRTATAWIVTPAVFLSVCHALVAAQPTTAPQPWWHDSTAGLVGGIVGSVAGLFGGIIGTLCGLGRGRRFVLACMKVLIALGVISLLAGLVAVSLSQPYGVYYPLLLFGVITLLVMGLNYRTARQRYEAIELRKMESMDAP